MICSICGSPKANLHFGAISCRACAAFFCRYLTSKSAIKSCVCSQRTQNSHPCGECRIRKCWAAGMQPSKNQKSLLHMVRVPSRDNPHISTKTPQFWQGFEQKRKELCAGGTWNQWTIYGVTSFVNRDSKTLWSLVSQLFPRVLDFKPYDKDSLLANFVPKWYQLESAMDLTKNVTKWKGPMLTVEDAMVNYYRFQDGKEGKDGKSKSLSRSDMIRTFGRFYEFYVNHVVLPITKRRFDENEFMALILFLFFDNGYTNITEKCAEMCRDIRKVILRELRAYQRDISDDDDDDAGDKRFLSTMEVPLMIEKSGKIFEEEMLVCEMHHVRIHEDFLEAMRRHNL